MATAGIRRTAKESSRSRPAAARAGPKAGARVGGAAPKPAVNGSQSIHRAFSLLRLVASARSAGIRLAEVATATGLHVATAHRLLGAMQRERFVTFDPYSRLYHIGHEFLALGEGSRESRIRDHYRPVLAFIADATEDSVYLSTLSGNDAVCIDRAEGRFPIRTITLDIGARRPLGVGGGSLALLAALPNQRIETALAANESRYAQYNGMTAGEVRTLVRTCQRRGFAFNDGRVIEGVSAVGLPVLAEDGGPVAAISVAAIKQRMGPARRRQIAEMIRRQIDATGWPRGAT